MHPVDGRSLPGLSVDQERMARRIGDSIAGRTGTKCFYNQISGKLLFCYDVEPHGGPLVIPFRNKDGTIKDHRGTIDDMVTYINFGKMPREMKDKIESDRASSEQKDAEQARGRFSDGNRKNALDYADFLGRKRRGTAKVSA